MKGARPGVPAWAFLIFLPVMAAAHPEADAFRAEGAGARALGMGGAQTALSEDLFLLSANPAGLASLGRPALSALYAPSPLQASSLFAAYGFPFRRAAVAAGLFQRRVADIELTNAAGTVLGSKSFTDQAGFLSAAAGSVFPVGITLKRLRSRFAPYDVSGTGADLGAQSSWRSFRAGLTWQDVGGTALSGDAYAGGKARQKIPSRLRAGAAFSGLPLNGPAAKAQDWAAVLAVDALFSLENGDPTEFFAGGEIWSQGRLAVRGGWGGDRGWSAGASVNLARFRLDYAVVLSKDAPPLSRLATHFLFGGTP